jgi:hypothetical protein
MLTTRVVKLLGIPLTIPPPHVITVTIPNKTPHRCQYRMIYNIPLISLPATCPADVQCLLTHHVLQVIEACNNCNKCTLFIASALTWLMCSEMRCRFVRPHSSSGRAVSLLALRLSHTRPTAPPMPAGKLVRALKWRLKCFTCKQSCTSSKKVPETLNQWL